MKNFKEKEILEEDKIETGLLLAGFIPVIGEVFDIALIIRYFKQNRYIEGFLMLIALIPTVGDFIVKPFLGMARGAKAFSSTARFSEFLAKNGKAGELYSKMGKNFESPVINKLINQISKIFPNIGKTMREAQSFHINKVGKLSEVSGTVIKGPGKLIQQGFRRGALEKYIAKHGVEPSNWLSGWWNIVYKGRTSRRNLIHKTLASSGLLSALGLPNIQSLENMMSTKEGAEKLAQNPKFNEFYNNVTSEQDEAQIQQPQSNNNNSAGSGLLNGGLLSIPLLKSLANVAIR